MDSRVRRAIAAISPAGAQPAKRGRRVWLAAVLASCVVGGLGCSAGSGAQAAASAATATEVILKPTHGASTVKPTWSVTKACPPGYQGSGVLYTLNSDGSIGSIMSPVVPHVTSPFGGTVLVNVEKTFALGTDIKPGGTSRWIVGCDSGIGATGKEKLTQSVYVTLSADGKSYTSSFTPPGG